MICALCLVASCAGVLTGCGETKLTEAEYAELAKTNAAANAKKVVLTIEKGDKKYDVTLDMFTYYLAYNEADGNDNYNANLDYYQSIYGEETSFWDMPGTNGQTMGAIYKEAVYSSMLYTLLMYYEAKESNVTMTDGRVKMLDTTTQQFLAKFTPEQRARCGMTTEVIRDNYERIFLADQFSSIMASNVVIDRDAIAATIDRENYRTYKTYYVYLTKSDENAELTMKAGDTAKRVATMNECYQDALSGTSLADVYSKRSDILNYGQRDFSIADSASLDEQYVNVVLNMKVGDIRLLETNYGIYIIQLTDNTTYYGYEDAVTEAVSEAQNKGINSIYKTIEQQYTITKTEEWDNITMGTILAAPKK